MLSTFGRVNPFFGHARVPAARKRRHVQLVPSTEKLEDRTLLTITLQSGDYSCGVQIDGISSPAHGNAFLQRYPNITNISDSFNNAVAVPGTDEGGSCALSFSSSFSQSSPNSDAGTIATSVAVQTSSSTLFQSSGGGATDTIRGTVSGNDTLILNYTGSSSYKGSKDSSNDYSYNVLYVTPDYTASSTDVTYTYQTSGTYKFNISAGTTYEIEVDTEVNHETFAVGTDPGVDLSASSNLDWQINAVQQQPVVTLGSAPNPSTYGQSVTFTATVSPATSGLPTPTGTVTFMDGSAAIGTGTLNASGVATAMTSTLPVGTDQITAVFNSGDNNYSNSTSSPIPQTVNKATPTVSVSDAGGISNGMPFPATATVAGVVVGVDDKPAATLEGVSPTLTYYAGSIATGTPLPAAPSAAGTYTVMATFPGSADYASASDATTFVIKEPAPTVSFTNFLWYGYDDNSGMANTEGRRGVVFSYTVTGSIPASMTIPIAFYWATGTDPKNIITPAYTYNNSTPDTVNINTTPGNHGYGTSEPFQAGNDPARWGKPPPNATDILAVIDPNNKLGEPDAPSAANKRVAYLTLPASVSDVLQRSVEPVGKGIDMTATFSPGDGIGQPMPLSEAEVYLGVDHFNWLQEITYIPNAPKVIELQNSDNLTNFSLFLYYNNIDTNIYNYTIPLLKVDYSSKIPYTVEYPDYIDPIQEPLGGARVTRGIVTAGGVTVTYGATTFPDVYPYYWDETSNISSHVYTVNDQQSSYILNFLDDPKMLLIDNPNRDFLKFSTELVGVKYNISDYIKYSESPYNYNTKFNWQSNVVGDIGSVKLLATASIPDTTGIPEWDIPGWSYSSGSVVVEGFVHNPTVYVKIIPTGDQTLQIGKKLTLDISARSEDHEAITYQLSGSVPANAQIAPIGPDTALAAHIDPITSAVFTFVPQTTGTFPVTITATDLHGRSDSTTFNITVLPATAATPPSQPSTPSTPTAPSTPSSPSSSTSPAGQPPTTTNPVPLSSGYGLGRDTFVTTVYREVLDRSPEPAGLRYWSSKLAAHVRPAAIVRAVFRSPERRVLDELGIAPKITPRHVLRTLAGPPGL